MPYAATIGYQFQAIVMLGSTTGLTLAALDSVIVTQAGSYVADPVGTLGMALAEIDALNAPGFYSLTLTPTELGALSILLLEGLESSFVQVQVGSPQIRTYVAGELADALITITSGGSPLQGATVRLYDGTTLVGSGTTDSGGQVTFAVPPGDYTYRVTAAGNVNPGPQSLTVTANEENVPLLEELFPATASIGDRIVLRGRYFDSSGDVSVFFDGVEQAAVPVASDGRVIYVDVPAGLTNTAVQVYVRKDDPDVEDSYLSSNTLTLVRT